MMQTIQQNISHASITFEVYYFVYFFSVAYSESHT